MKYRVSESGMFFFWKCYCSKTVKHIDLKWCFLDSQHYNFWYSCLTFAKKKREIRKILIWKQWKIYIINFFLKFLKKFFALNRFLGWFEAKKLEFFFKLKFFSFFLSFSQRLGMNIKSHNLGYLKSQALSFGQTCDYTVCRQPTAP